MHTKSIKFTQAPLPFMGQKRRFLNQVKDIVKHCVDETVFVDLFGGSGLLSHTIKSFKPNSRVVYNDYDNYRKRIQNIHNTNELLKKLRTITNCIPEKTKIDKRISKMIIDCIESEENNTGYVDYISLSSNLLFSMKYVQSLEELKKETLYNKIRKSDYNADGYLEGLTITELDYRELFNQYKNYPNVVFLVDPPYLSTETGTYKNYWKLKDYLDVLDVVRDTNYIYFTSNKSSIIELCEWMGNRPNTTNPFEGSTTTTTNNSMNYNSSYTDIMLSKVRYKMI